MGDATGGTPNADTGWWIWPTALGAVDPSGKDRVRGGREAGLQTDQLALVADGTLAQRCAGELFMAVTVVTRCERGRASGDSLHPEQLATQGELDLPYAGADERRQPTVEQGGREKAESAAPKGIPAKRFIVCRPIVFCVS